MITIMYMDIWVSQNDIINIIRKKKWIYLWQQNFILEIFWKISFEQILKHSDFKKVL